MIYKKINIIFQQKPIIYNYLDKKIGKIPQKILKIIINE